MAPTTPADWLPILTRRLDLDAPRVRVLRRYIDGDAPLPEMGKNTRASWQKFQRESRTNWGLLITEAVANRIVPIGIQIGGSTKSPEAVQAQRIWRDNRMDVVFKDAVRYMCNYRRSYIAGWTGDDGQAILTACSPEFMYAATEPLQPWRVRAALSWWRDLDEEKDYALVWIRGGWQLFSRPCYFDDGGRRLKFARASGDWVAAGEFTATGSEPPVVVLDNPSGAGDFETHLDLINRINRGVLQRLVTEAMQAFRQRALKAKEGTPGLPDKDEQGNDIDWSKVFEPAPGALWDLPPGIELWESQQTDVRPMLDAAMNDIRQLSAVTQTAISVLIPDNANQSAEGAIGTKEGMIFRAEERLAVARTAAAAALLVGLRIEGTEPADTIEVLFRPPAMVSLSEKYAAAAQAKNAGEPWASIARNILGYSPQQISQAALDRADEQLAAALATPLQAPASPVNVNA